MYLGEVKLTYNQVLPFKVCADSQVAARRPRTQAYLLEVYRPRGTKIGVGILKVLHSQCRQEPEKDKTSQRLDLPSPQASQCLTKIRSSPTIITFQEQKYILPTDDNTIQSLSFFL